MIYVVCGMCVVSSCVHCTCGMSALYIWLMCDVWVVIVRHMCGMSVSYLLFGLCVMCGCIWYVSSV